MDAKEPLVFILFFNSELKGEEETDSNSTANGPTSYFLLLFFLLSYLLLERNLKAYGFYSRRLTVSSITFRFSLKAKYYGIKREREKDECSSVYWKGSPLSSSSSSFEKKMGEEGTNLPTEAEIRGDHPIYTIFTRTHDSTARACVCIFVVQRHTYARVSTRKCTRRSSLHR